MVSDLRQFEHFHEDADQIYRITTEVTTSGNKRHYASSPPALAEFIQSNNTSIIESAVINDAFFPTMEVMGESIQMNGYLTEPSFLNLFDFEVLYGTANAIDNPRSVIITYELAEKLFNETDVVGKSLKTENQGSFEIGAVLTPFPKQTHLRFDLLANISLSEDRSISGPSGWTNFGGNYFYFKTELAQKEIERMIDNSGKAGTDFFALESEEANYVAQPLLAINPGPNYDDGLGVIFGYDGLWYFIGVSLMILIPACFNYVNMAIANTLNRTKEIGIRKIIGSPNKFIIRQFIVETIIICLISVLLSTVFNVMKIEFTSMLVGADALTFEITTQVVLMFIGFAVLTGLLTGIVPAFYLSRIAPISALNNRMNNKSVSISGFRKGLLVFQFVLSLSFMIGIGVVIRQYAHTLKYDPGFAKEDRVILPIASGDIDLISNELNGIKGIESLVYSSSIPGLSLARPDYFYSNDGADSVRAKTLFISNNFIQNMEINMVWGNKSLEDVSFEQVIVNEKLLSLLNNIENDPKDSLLRQLGNHPVQIVGIIKDYNHEPLNERIEPMVMRLNENELRYAILEISGTSPKATLAQIEVSWGTLFPESSFNPKYLNTVISLSYDFMFTAMKLFGFLALLSITISCLGLLGMVIYATENRRKEVAIRKILGANAMALFGNLSGLFLKLWLIALCIAMPGAYFFYDNLFVNNYNKFSGGVHLSEVLISSVITLGLGLLAIFWQSNKIIRMNPAANLRNE